MGFKLQHHSLPCHDHTTVSMAIKGTLRLGEASALCLWLDVWTEAVAVAVCLDLMVGFTPKHQLS